MKKKNRGKFIIIGILGVILIFIILGSFFGSRVTKILVKDIERYIVEKGNLSLTAVGSGKIHSSDIRRVVPTGTINEVKVGIGDYILKNEVLGTIIIDGKTKNFTSPYSGVVTNVPGNNTFGTSFSTYFEISDINNLEMIIQVTEKDIYKVKEDSIASIYIEALDLEIEGDVSRISLVGKDAGDLSVYDVTVSFKKEDNDIYLGMTGSARIIVETKEDIIMIPVDALVEKDSKKYVLESKWLNNINRPQSDYYIEVETGISDASYVEIVEGDILEKEILILPEEDVTFRMMMENHQQ